VYVPLAEVLTIRATA